MGSPYRDLVPKASDRRKGALSKERPIRRVVVLATTSVPGGGGGPPSNSLRPIKEGLLRGSQQFKERKKLGKN